MSEPETERERRDMAGIEKRHCNVDGCDEVRFSSIGMEYHYLREHSKR